MPVDVLGYPAWPSAATPGDTGIPLTHQHNLAVQQRCLRYPRAFQVAKDTSMWATEVSPMYCSLPKAFAILKGGRKCRTSF